MTVSQGMPEKPGAVRLMRRLERLQDTLTGGPLRRSLRHWMNRPTWPSAPGAYYLGAELAKAETALRLGLRYEQDQPLRPYGHTK